MSFEHKPVLLAEVVDYLSPRPDKVYVDCTVGGGGHAGAIMEATGPGGFLVGLDADPEALEASRQRLERFGQRIRLVHARYEELDRALDAIGVGKVDGVLFDLGVSSPQFDRPERGFSYRYDAALDMRMDPTRGPSAADLLATSTVQELTKIIRSYGEERWASRIAAFIVERRARTPIKTTTDLVDTVKAAIPASARRRGGHPARRTFQALRIAVNRELVGLGPAIEVAVDRLYPGGRVVVISYHSLEDRIVKNTFNRLEGEGDIDVLTRKPVNPLEDERKGNPRSKGAKLRAALRRGTNEPSINGTHAEQAAQAAVGNAQEER